MMDLCPALKETHLFSHYAYGDPLPFYARYYGGDGKPTWIEEAATIYVRCQREVRHSGMHLARGVSPWEDES